MNQFRITAAAGKLSIDVFGAVGGDPMEGGITAASVQAALKSAGKLSLIELSINSGGGEFFQGLAIFNLLRSTGVRIEATIFGLAASAASIIAMSGDRIAMQAESFLMIHEANLLAIGGADDLRQFADQIEGCNDAMASIYAKRSGQSIEAVKQLMRDETWMNAAQAVDLGFADAILADQQRIAASVSAEVLAKFQNVPVAVRAAIAADPAPKPERAASYSELKAALIGADERFCLKIQDRGLGIEAAKRAWMIEQGNILAGVKISASKPGLEPLATARIETGWASTSPAREWNAAIEAKMAAGLTRTAATSAVARERPELREELVESANAGRR